MSNIKTILYKSKKLSSGEHPVMLYIYEDKAYRIGLGYSCSLKDWNENTGRFRKSYPNSKTKNLNLRKYELKADEIIDDFVRNGERFDFSTFKSLFKGEQPQEKSKTFYQFFEEMIEEKKQLGKAGTAKTYKDAYNTLKKYHPKDFSFDKYDYRLLKGLETSLFARGNTAGGISVRMRTLRAIFYEAVKRGYAKKESNPYSTSTNRDGYSLAHLKSERNPRALSEEELEKFKSFDIEQYPQLADSWRYFMFSFRLFGINFIDICNLKQTDFVNGRIHYKRQKTKKQFALLVTDEVLEIIEHFRTHKQYLFPIFDEEVHISPMQKKNRSEKILKQVNKDLKEIAKIQGIQTHITFYTARHSSATTLKRKGIATDVISESLGHSDLATTQIYLKKFDNEVLDSVILKL